MCTRCVISQSTTHKTCDLVEALLEVNILYQQRLFADLSISKPMAELSMTLERYPLGDGTTFYTDSSSSVKTKRNSHCSALCSTHTNKDSTFSFIPECSQRRRVLDVIARLYRFYFQSVYSQRRHNIFRIPTFSCKDE